MGVLVWDMVVCHTLNVGSSKTHALRNYLCHKLRFFVFLFLDQKHHDLGSLTAKQSKHIGGTM